MSKNWLSHIIKKHLLSKVSLLLIFFIFSCNDRGCIDADDFGEYESETIEILSNNSANDCTYYPAIELTSSQQGKGLIPCFSQGVINVPDTEGDIHSNADDDNESTTDEDLGGCAGFISASLRNICITSCINTCLLEATSDSGLSEPNWNSTNSRSSTINSGVTIKPNSEIFITASGSVNFGGDIEFDSSYVDVKQLVPHSYDSSENNNFFNVKNGQLLNLEFSNEWSNGSSNFGGKVAMTSSGISDSDIRIYNGSRRIVSYAVKYPEGHSFNSNAASEKSGSLGVPLLPDPFAWTCSYTSNDKTESTCGHKTDSYTSIGYNEVNNDLTEKTFPVSSSEKISGLTTYGGFIRWNDDGLKNNDYDPFANAGISCSMISGEFQCGSSSALSSLEGQLVDKNEDGDPDNELGNSENEITISHPGGEYSYQVSFKSLAGNACHFDNTNIEGFKFRIEDQYGFTLDSTKTPIPNSPKEVVLAIDDDWSSYQISLEPNQSIKIPNITLVGKEHCRLAIAARFLKYHDLKIQTSGFVNFTTLNAASGNCHINGRIINPEGSHSADTFKIDDKGTANDISDDITSSISNFDSDFYEYDNFTISSSSSSDPLASLLVYPSGSSTLNWGDSVFVRKGQIIRFSPNSWDSTFTTLSGPERTCGIGMAMRIIPRPALLCRGVSSEYIKNQNCVPDFDDDNYNIIGCSSDAPECLDPNGSSFCITEGCRANITCSDGVEPYYNKTCNDLPLDGNNHITPSDVAACDAASENPDSCTSCSQAMLTAARQPSNILISSLDQCYDLEEYKGKVANIPSTTGFTDMTQSYQTKGAEILGPFNGKYGNFTNFHDSKETDSSTGNRIFKISTPLIFSHSSRMQFFALDGDNFNNSLTGSAGNSSVYDNNSGDGYKINATTSLSSTNGEWLQVTLCQDDGSDLICDNVNNAPQVTNQPTGVMIDSVNSSIDSPILTSESSYKFDAYGNLVRTSNKDLSQGDCGITEAGSYFYCHTVPNEDDNIKNLRLSFQIVDPEITNCDIDNPSSTDETAYDGVILSNPKFDSSDTANNNAICPADTDSTPLTDCKKELYCSNKYANNDGSYFVQVKVKDTSSSDAASIIESVINPVIKVMDGDRKDCNTKGLEIGSDGTITKNDTEPTASGVIIGGNPSIDYSGVYDPTNPANIGATCTLEEFENRLCTGEFYCKTATVGQAERIYKLLIADERYKAIVTISLVMMITFYGMTFLMGVSEISHAELVNRIIKIGLIYLFIGEFGWDWFNTFIVKFFKDGTDYLAFLMASSFDTDGHITSAINAGNYYDKSVLFSSVDNVLDLLSSDPILKKISALLFASIFGWAYILIICFSLMLYIYAVANAVLLYLTAQVFISILFTLGPIFFLFTLFDKTKEMFDNWIKQLIGFSLQQIFLLTTLAFFNMMMYEVIKMSLGYKICWDDVWTINVIVRVSLLSWWNIASLPPRTDSQAEVANIGNPEGIPSLFTILFIWIIASLMNKFIGFMTELASQISGGLSAKSLSEGIKSATQSLKKMAASYLSEIAEQSGVNKKIQRMDQFLFNSGKLADSERIKTKEARKTLGSRQRQAVTAGNKAVKNKEAALKKEGKSMSKDDKAQTRKNAMQDEYKRMGMNESEIETAMNDSGIHPSEFSASAIGGATISSARSGTLFKSNKDKSANNEKGTVFSSNEAKAALNNMDSEAERDDFINKVDSGEIKVNRSNYNKSFGAAGAAGRALSNPKKAASNAGKYVKDKTTATAKSFAKTITSPVEKADSLALGGKKGLEAEKLLVESGAIKQPQKSGFKGLYSKKDKKKISDLRETLTVEDNKGNVGAAADLRRHVQKINDPDHNDQELTRSQARAASLKNTTKARHQSLNEQLNKTSAAIKENDKKRNVIIPNKLEEIDQKEGEYLENSGSKELKEALDNPDTRKKARANDETLAGLDKNRNALKSHKANLQTKSEALKSKEKDIKDLMKALPPEQKDKTNASSIAVNSDQDGIGHDQGIESSEGENMTAGAGEASAAHDTESSEMNTVKPTQPNLREKLPKIFNQKPKSRNNDDNFGETKRSTQAPSPSFIEEDEIESSEGENMNAGAGEANAAHDTESSEMNTVKPTQPNLREKLPKIFNQKPKSRNNDDDFSVTSENSSHDSNNFEETKRSTQTPSPSFLEEDEEDEYTPDDPTRKNDLSQNSNKMQNRNFPKTQAPSLNDQGASRSNSYFGPKNKNPQDDLNDDN